MKVLDEYNKYESRFLDNIRISRELNYVSIIRDNQTNWIEIGYFPTQIFVSLWIIISTAKFIDHKK